MNDEFEQVGKVMRGTNGGPYGLIEEYGHDLGHKLLNGEITSEEAVERRKEELKEQYDGDVVVREGLYWEIYADDSVGLEEALDGLMDATNYCADHDLEELERECSDLYQRVSKASDDDEWTDVSEENINDLLDELTAGELARIKERAGFGE